jgi:hypothetical protein
MRQLDAVSDTVCGEPGALDVMVMLPLASPSPGGLNDTVIVHEAFTATVPQPFTTE